MDVKMEVYTPYLELIGVLEIQRCVIWEQRAFSAGSFSLESLITEDSNVLLVPENIIWIAGDYAGVIEHVQQQAGENGPYITVKGRDLTGLLDRNILWGRYALSGTVADVMRRLVDDCCIHPTRGDTEARKIPGLVLAEADGMQGASILAQKTGGTLLEALEELGEAYGVAFGVRFNPQVPQMEFWTRPGINRSVGQSVNEPVFYSTELDDVLSSEYTYDSGNYRSVALVAGEGEGNERVMVTVNGETAPSPTPPEPPTPEVKYTVTASIDPAGSGTVTGAGQYQEGASVTIKAEPAEEYEFTAWQENGQTVSEDAEYTFTITGNRALVAVFAEKGLGFDSYVVQDVFSVASAYYRAYGLIYAEKKFILLTYERNAENTNTKYCLRYTDRVNGEWNKIEIAESSGAYSPGGIAYGNGYYVIVENQSEGSGTINVYLAILYSTSLEGPWTRKEIANIGCSYCDKTISFVNGRFVICGNVASSRTVAVANQKSTPTIWYTDNPSGTWTKKSVGANNYQKANAAYGMIYDGVNYVTCTAYKTQSATSDRYTTACYIPNELSASYKNNILLKGTTSAAIAMIPRFNGEKYAFIQSSGYNLRYLTKIDGESTYRSLSSEISITKDFLIDDLFVLVGRKTIATNQYAARLVYGKSLDGELKSVDIKVGGNTNTIMYHIIGANGVYAATCFSYDGSVYHTSVVWINPDWMKQ